MTPYEHWENYTRRLHSPRNYNRLAFYFMVGAALQRRVWLGGDGQEIFPNQFLLFVADPGVGKGLATNAAKRLLLECKHRITPEHPEGKDVFNIAADSGSFEKMVSSLVESTTTFSYRATKDALTPLTYIHSSSIFFMDELTSMIHKESKLITPFLLTTWDCKPFRRDTHKHGKEVIRNTCPSIFANTQPDTFQDLLQAKVMGTGLLGRFLISYAPKNQYPQFLLPPLDASAKESEGKIREFLKGLSSLFGPLTISAETLDFCQQWWIKSANNPINKSPLLKEFYGRKNIHILKLAIAVHFSRTLTDYEITRGDCEEAIKIIEAEEPAMHLAFNGAGLNKFSQVAMRIQTLIKQISEPVSRKQILVEMYSDISGADLDVVLQDLVSQGKLKQVIIKGEIKYDI